MSKAGEMSKLGFYKGRHYTEYDEKVKALKRARAIWTKQRNSFLGLRMLLGKNPGLKVVVRSLVL